MHPDKHTKKHKLYIIYTRLDPIYPRMLWEAREEIADALDEIYESSSDTGEVLEGSVWLMLCQYYRRAVKKSLRYIDQWIYSGMVNGEDSEE